jgi:hypothetical protein
MDTASGTNECVSEFLAQLVTGTYLFNHKDVKLIHLALKATDSGRYEHVNESFVPTKRGEFSDG